MLRYLIALSFSIFPFIYTYAQTSISGIINSYAKVVAIDYCAQQLTLEQADDFQIDDQILIIQMQGAEINTSDSNQFGSISNLNGAGLCEKATIVDIQNNIVTLEFALANAYEVSGNIQIVNIPQYTSAIVKAPLLAQDWDGNTGGVITLNADTLALQADIDASGAGFRGGTLELDYDGDCFWFIVHNNYVYDSGSIRGGNKGEGIYQITPDIARGKGAAANGGGGGNDHNAGGGGGGLISAGGSGGDNNNPSTFGCQGAHPGIGGYAIGMASQRLFMGGGGGAGHTNNANNPTKVDGGGIVLIETGFLSANGYTIRSNGEDAPTTTSSDGASGGGAGGSLYIQADNQDGSSLSLETKGGNGGHANNFGNDQCFGPGGGGAGGFISTNATLLYTANTDGGNAGLSINSSSCGEGTNGAQNGDNGQLGELTIPESTLANEPPEITAFDTIVPACLSSSATLEAAISGENYTLQWQVDMGNGYVGLTEGAIFEGVNTATLFISTVETPFFGYSFRLQLIDDCGTIVYSPPVTIEQYPYPIPFYSWVIDGLTINFTNLSSFADTYQWFFGDGESSTDSDPVYTYDVPGLYNITLIAENECGTDSLSIPIQLGEAPTAQFTVEGSSGGCEPFQATFSNLSVGTYDSLLWAFPGGTPASSTLEAPTVLYENAGTYNVSLTLYSSYPPVNTTALQYIEVYAFPTPGFDYTINGLEVTFTNLSIMAEDYNWSFGDGNTSMEENPVHTYQQAGTYNVSLNATNGNCNVATSSTIVLSPNSTANQQTQQYLVVFPNPTTGRIDIQSSRKWDRWALYSSLGMLIDSGEYIKGQTLDFTYLPTATYWLAFTDAAQTVQLPFIIMK